MSISIFNVKDENGNWISIPAIRGEKGDKGDAAHIYADIKDNILFVMADGFTDVSEVGR